jgi:hypothetical protein
MTGSWLIIFALVSIVIAPPIVLSCTYPSLTNATIEDLATGLEDGCFTSVDLVKVSSPCYIDPHQINCENIGIY